MNKGNTLWILLTLGFAALSGILGVQVYGASRGDAAVVATVNGEAITKAQFYDSLVDQGGDKVLQDLIEQRLIQQEAKKSNIAVTPEELKAKMDEIRNSFGSELEFQAALMQAGLDQQKLEAAVSKNLLAQKLVEPKAQANVTDEAVRKYFDENRAQFDEPEQVHARHILVKDKAEAEAILAQLKGGADFAALAKEKSTDPGSRDKGGDLGFFSRGQMVPEFEQAAFSLPVNGLSEVVQTQFGYHVIQVLEKKEAKPADFEQVKEKIRQNLLNQEYRTLIPQWLEEAKGKANIVNTLNPAGAQQSGGAQQPAGGSPSK